MLQTGVAGPSGNVDQMSKELVQSEESLPAAPQQDSEKSVSSMASDSIAARLPSREWIILLALAAAMLAQLWTSVVQLSITSDEVDHLHAGYRYWQCNDFGWNPEHPPLVKIVAGLPLQFLNIKDPIQHACGLANDKEDDFILGHDFVFANSEGMLTAARFAVSLFPLILLLGVWFFARKLFGLPVAIISGVLIAFEPNVLAHGALVTTDVAAAAGMLLAIYALYCYTCEPTFTRLLALGLATGFALSVKHSMVLLALILPALLLSDCLLRGRHELRRRLLHGLGALAAGGAIALMVLWATYGFRYAARPGGAAVAEPPNFALAHGTVATRTIPQLETWHLAPQAYLVGLQDVLIESDVGRPVFVLGKTYHEGKWFYFPVAAAVKFILPLLLLILLSASSFPLWKSKLRELLYLLLPVIIYLSFSMSSKLNMGVRHLLPVVPLLTIFAAAGSWALARRQRWAMIALLILLLWHTGSSLHAFPNYLSYSNELWGGPAETYRHLSNSDDDWGQAQKMARDYVERNRISNCYILHTYTTRNSDYGIPCGGFSDMESDPVPVQFTGTVIVSSTLLDRVVAMPSTVAIDRIFKGMKPKAKLGGSALLVYQGTFNMSPIVAGQLLIRAYDVRDQDPQLSLQLSQRAAALDPSNGRAHVYICNNYHRMGADDKAIPECIAGFSLLRNNPEENLVKLKYLEDMVIQSGLPINRAGGE